MFGISTLSVDNPVSVISKFSSVSNIWLLKKVESTKDNYIKYMLTSEKEFNIFVNEIREYIIDNQILAIDNKTSLAQILDEQINEMHEEDLKNEN